MAKLRAELGWSQARLAGRVGVSRVAISHIEAGLTNPSERTVTLMASAFGREPPDLVAGTTYPAAKAERLPLVVARHTEVDHQVAVLAAVLAVLERLPDDVRVRVAADVRAEWGPRLRALDVSLDAEARDRLGRALATLSALG